MKHSKRFRNHGVPATVARDDRRTSLETSWDRDRGPGIAAIEKASAGPLRVLAATAALCLLLTACAAPQQEEAPDLSDFVWPLPPEQPRIQFVRFLRTDEDIGAVEETSLADALLGKETKASNVLRKPYGVHADKSGRVFVTDTALGKLAVFDMPNEKFAFWGEVGKGALAKPIGVTSDSQGRIYVTDVTQKRVVIYDRDGEFVLAMGRKGELDTPTGIVVDQERGRIYVADTRQHHIAVFDMAGVMLTTIGERGPEPGQFNFPTNLALDPDGRLYVTDSMNFRVQILDPDSGVFSTFGKQGDGAGYFARPKGIALDSDGHIYVVDAAFDNFQIFDRDGQLLLFVGSGGFGPGRFRLPAGAYIDAQDQLYVADQYNHQIQVFKYLDDQGREPAAADGDTPPADAAE